MGKIRDLFKKISDSKGTSHTKMKKGQKWSGNFPYFLQFKSEFGNKEFMI